MSGIKAFYAVCSLFLAGLILPVDACTLNMAVPETTPSSDFTLNSDGTTLHNTTGLMWKRCAEGQVWAAGSCVGSTSIFTWQNALQHTADTNLGAAFAGHSDWRVPNIQELQSILEEQCSNPTINSQVFPATSIITPYWSASPWVGNSVSAWGVRFDIGIAGAYAKSNYFSLRLVRGGQ